MLILFRYDVFNVLCENCFVAYYNSNSIEMGEVMSIMKKCGINIDFVEDEAFEEKTLGFFDVSA